MTEYGFTPTARQSRADHSRQATGHGSHPRQAPVTGILRSAFYGALCKEDPQSLAKL